MGSHKYFSVKYDPHQYGDKIQTFYFVYSGRTPEHHCTVPYGGSVNESIPIDQDTGELHKCKMYAENSTNVTTSCQYGWTYNNVDGDYTIVNEVAIVIIKCNYDQFNKQFMSLADSTCAKLWPDLIWSLSFMHDLYSFSILHFIYIYIIGKINVDISSLHSMPANSFVTKRDLMHLSLIIE